MCCKGNKCIIPVAVSVIVGIIIGALFFAGNLAASVILTPIIFATAFAGAVIALLFIASAFAIKKEVKKCICEYGKCLTLGGIGTLVVGFIALTFIASLVAGSVGAAFLLGIGGFFLFLTVLSFVGLLVCLISSNCHRHCEFDECE